MHGLRCLLVFSSIQAAPFVVEVEGSVWK